MSTAERGAAAHKRALQDRHADGELLTENAANSCGNNPRERNSGSPCCQGECHFKHSDRLGSNRQLPRLSLCEAGIHERLLHDDIFGQGAHLQY